MSRKYFRMLVALAGLAGFVGAAKAQVPDQIVVNIPFEFSVGGKTLPAGSYRVNRLSNANNRTLLLSSFENRAGAVVTASSIEPAAGDKADLIFENAGDQHFLSKIDTGDHLFIIPVSRKAVLVASGKSHGGGVTGNASGNN